jgi:hypothetical protein
MDANALVRKGVPLRDVPYLYPYHIIYRCGNKASGSKMALAGELHDLRILGLDIFIRGQDPQAFPIVPNVPAGGTDLDLDRPVLLQVGVDQRLMGTYRHVDPDLGCHVYPPISYDNK